MFLWPTCFGWSRAESPPCVLYKTTSDAHVACDQEYLILRVQIWTYVGYLWKVLKIKLLRRKEMVPEFLWIVFFAMHQIHIKSMSTSVSVCHSFMWWIYVFLVALFCDFLVFLYSTQIIVTEIFRCFRLLCAFISVKFLHLLFRYFQSRDPIQTVCRCLSDSVNPYENDTPAGLTLICLSSDWQCQSRCFSGARK
jgi:hypothetical protein